MSKKNADPETSQPKVKAEEVDSMSLLIRFLEQEGCKIIYPVGQELDNLRKNICHRQIVVRFEFGDQKYLFSYSANSRNGGDVVITVEREIKAKINFLGGVNFIDKKIINAPKKEKK